MSEDVSNREPKPGRLGQPSPGCCQLERTKHRECAERRCHSFDRIVELPLEFLCDARRIRTHGREDVFAQSQRTLLPRADGTPSYSGLQPEAGISASAKPPTGTGRRRKAVGAGTLFLARNASVARAAASAGRQWMTVTRVEQWWGSRCPPSTPIRTHPPPSGIRPSSLFVRTLRPLFPSCGSGRIVVR